MPVYKLTLEDYQHAADAANLDFIGEIVDDDPREILLKLLQFDFQYQGDIPPTALTPTWWRCRLTGKMMRKTVTAVRRSEYGSRYQRDFAEESTLQKYHDLANYHGIQFLYDKHHEFFPATTKTPCRWLGRNGKVVWASYHNLAYDLITEEMIYELGIEDDYDFQRVH